jgi:hypothetical protein
MIQHPHPMSSLEDLFCEIDDFCQNFEPQWFSQLLGNGLKSRKRARGLCLSEIMTILVSFHQNHDRNFKHFFLDYVCVYWRNAFPGLPSYQRFVEWIPSTLVPLCAYIKQCFGNCTGISFIDATSLKVCHNRPIPSHRVFQNLAARGKTSVDWFLGFKLHIEFFAKPRRNLKNHLIRLTDKLLARKRSIIETIIDQLKNISQIEHSRHRSPVNFAVNVLCGLIADSHQPKKPSLHLEWALPPSA